MIQNLLLTGGPGPGHDFAVLARTISDVLSGEAADDLGSGVALNGLDRKGVDRRGIATTIVDDPTEAFARLRDGTAGGEPFSLFTVNALRWSMGAERYAAQRDAFAYTLGAHELDAVDELLARGGGVLAVHTAAICFDAHPRWHRLLGASWNWDRSSHPPYGPLDIRISPDGADHVLTRAIPPFAVSDEVYINLDMERDIVPLLTASTADHPTVSDAPVLWARQHGGGRVVTDLLGHDVGSLTHPLHRVLLRDAALWAALGDEAFVKRSNGQSMNSETV